jgi:glycosyltransferase involved in cell wall biosynthesis
VLARNLEGVDRFLVRLDDVPELMALAAVVVLPSLAESFGFVLLEAMSVGKPVVATTTGGIPEVVRDEETGLLVPAEDSGLLANAICRVLEDDEFARTLGDRGRLRAATFSFERMMCGYEAVYQQVLQRMPIGQKTNVETV